MTDLTVKWRTCGDDNHWCNFLRLNLESVTGAGIYIIWHGGMNPHVVRVGQGDVAKRLAEHRENPEITGYQSRGDLFVTWAALDVLYRDGVERYLAERYDPHVGDRFPDALPLSVNSPWGT